MSPGKPHLEQDRRGAQQVFATLARGALGLVARASQQCDA
jgi:hypothetical protein